MVVMMNIKTLTDGLAGSARSGATPSVKSDGGVNNLANAGRAAAPTESVAPGPAVSVKVSDIAAGTLAAVVSSTEFSDNQLLVTLKQRIKAGTFQIDYEGLAHSLVEDALQSIGQKRQAKD